MTHIGQALKEAIEAGYQWDRRKDYMAGGSANQALALMDPEFWQFCGKARGWSEGIFDSFYNTNMRWQHEWHRFIDHLAEGKDAESFFKDL